MCTVEVSTTIRQVEKLRLPSLSDEEGQRHVGRIRRSRPIGVRNLTPTLQSRLSNSSKIPANVTAPGSGELTYSNSLGATKRAPKATRTENTRTHARTRWRCTEGRPGREQQDSLSSDSDDTEESQGSTELHDNDWQNILFVGWLDLFKGLTFSGLFLKWKLTEEQGLPDTSGTWL